MQLDKVLKRVLVDSWEVVFKTASLKEPQERAGQGQEGVSLFYSLVL